MRPVGDDPLDELPTRQGFTALLMAFRATGGTARGNDVARLLSDHGVGDYIGVARLIANGDVFGFEWRHELWIPMFQFELTTLSVKPETRQVLAELGSAYNGWSCAAWFARSNSYLNLQTPVDLLETRLADVLKAARADRFLAVG